MALNLAGKVNDYAEKNAGNFLNALSENKKSPANQKKIKDDYDLEDTILRKNADTLQPVTLDTLQPFTVKFFNGWKLLFKGKADTAAFASVEKFAEPLLRRDLFENYLLAYGDTILFDELNISHKNLSEFLSTDVVTDSAKKVKAKSGEITEVTIGGEHYKFFFVSFITEGKEKFTLGGYMPLENYVSEQRYIPPHALLWLLIGIVLVVTMFPLLKVFLMHRSEQLLISNAITSLASLHVIGGMLVLIAINAYVYFNMVMSSANHNLLQLADSTQATFINELDASLTEMDNIDSVLKTRRLRDSLIPLQNVRIEIKKDSAKPDTSINNSESYKIGSSYPYFKKLAWMDATGQQKFRWSTSSYIPEKVDASERDYYQTVKSGNLWLRNGRPYYLTGISSWVSKKKSAVVSRPFSIKNPSDTNRKGLIIVSLSSPFRSMFNARFPEDYGFCIVKENGDVIFHLDETRSLNENLIEECNDNESLRSLLRTRSTGYISSRYSGTTQRFYIKSIAGTPYSVVTYRDMKTIWSEEVDVISACSILCLMNLAVILFAILIIQVSGYRRSLLQRQSLLFTWLRPNKELKNAYRSVSLFYWISMILQVLFFIFYDQKDQLCLVGIAFSYSFILLSYAYYQFAVFNNSDAGQKQQNKKPIYILTAFYVFTAIVFTINLASGKWMFIASQVCLLVIAWLFTRSHFLKNALLNHKNFHWWYVLSVFSFMAATAITPLVIFYFLSFNEERLLSLKRNQLEFANHFRQEPKDTLSATPNRLKLSYSAPFYFQNFADSITKLKASDTLIADNRNGFEILYKQIKPSFSSRSKETEFLIKTKDSSSGDFNWLYDSDSGRLELRYQIPKTRTYFDSVGIAIYSTLSNVLQDTGNSIKNDWLAFLLLIGALLLFLWGFNFLLNSLIQKIFFDGYDHSSHHVESLLPLLETLPDDENIFVNGPVNSGKHQLMAAYLSKKNIVVHDVDLVSLTCGTPENIVGIIKNNGANKTYSGKKSVVLLRHFETGIADLAMTEKKLLLLEELLQQKKQIIVLSSRSFDAMNKIEIKKNDAAGKDFTDRWSNVMNQFYNLYHHWERPKDTENLLKNAPKAELTEAERIKAEQIKAERIKAELIKAELIEAGNNKLTKFFIPAKASKQKQKIVALMQAYFKKRAEVFQTQIKLVKAKLAKLFNTETDPEEKQTKEVLIQKYFKKQVEDFLKRIDDECGHSDFLWSLHPALLNYLNEHKKDFLNFDFQNKKIAHMRKVINRHLDTIFERMCLKVQSLAANYYLGIWQAMSRDEQRTLYDIAMDDMVNPRNRNIASRLAVLGLVKPEQDIACYQVMNTSFRNFIFTQLDKKQIRTLQADADEKGSWNSFQLPVIIVVAAISIFLFTTQKDAFTSLITYLGAAAGGIAALLKILGMMPSNKT